MTPRLCWTLLLIPAALIEAQPRRSILLITDAEGVAGICRQDQTETTSAELQRLLTGEINAAVRGFRQAGAEDVYVWDGHGGSRTLSALTIEPPARLIQGALGPTMLLERGFTAIAFLGQHARANRAPAVMAHSYSSLGIQKMLLNGKEVGEIETRAALAGRFNTPVIFLSGDQAAAEDLRAIVPNAETAVVKEALGYYACISMTAPEAQALIQDKARTAWGKLAQIKPYRVEGPAEISIEYSTRSTPYPDATLPTGAERTGARTIVFRGRDFLEAWTRYSSR
jgi:D-amino peptidase